MPKCQKPNKVKEKHVTQEKITDSQIGNFKKFPKVKPNDGYYMGICIKFPKLKPSFGYYLGICRTFSNLKPDDGYYVGICIQFPKQKPNIGHYVGRVSRDWELGGTSLQEKLQFPNLGK